MNFFESLNWQLPEHKIKVLKGLVSLPRLVMSPLRRSCISSTDFMFRVQTLQTTSTNGLPRRSRRSDPPKGTKNNHKKEKRKELNEWKESYYAERERNVQFCFNFFLAVGLFIATYYLWLDSAKKYDK